MTYRELITYTLKISDYFGKPIHLQEIINLVVFHAEIEPESLYLIISKKINFNLIKYFNNFSIIKSGKPIQLVIGYVYFYNLKLKTNTGVFIPQNCTEKLIEMIVDKIKTNKIDAHQFKMFELGTGTGGISLVMKKIFNDKISIHATDISEDSITLAKQNSNDLNLKVEFTKLDGFKYFETIGKKCDVFIMNPPYLDKNDYISNSVLQWNKSTSLFANNYGLAFYEKFAKVYNNFCASKCIIGWEIGNKQKPSIEKIIKKWFPDFKTYFYRDYQGFWRVVILERGFDHDLQ